MNKEIIYEYIFEYLFINNPEITMYEAELTADEIYCLLCESAIN